MFGSVEPSPAALVRAAFYLSNLRHLQREKENRPKISKEQLIKVTNDLLDCKKWTAEMLTEILYNIQIDKENNNKQRININHLHH